MTFLILAIVSSTANHLLFKGFARHRIDLTCVLTINYAVCALIGWTSNLGWSNQYPIFTQSWYPFSIVQGILFVACFYLLGWTTARQGVAVAALATRLSVALPTVAAFFLFGDVISTPKTIGIVATLLALYLSCSGPRGSDSRNAAVGLLPVTLFAAFGAHSVLIKFVQERLLASSSYHAYVMSAFLSAVIASGSVMGWRLLMGHRSWGIKELVSGLALGCANYGAIYFLIRALSTPSWQSSALFPTISIAVVSLSSLGAWALFGEHVRRRMLVALAIGAVSIALLHLDG